MILRKKYFAAILSLTLSFAMLSAVVPLHNIFHHHHFIKGDTCGSNCPKHLKDYSKPCCTTSDAIFLATLTKTFPHIKVFRTLQLVLGIEKAQNYFQFFHFSKNKAPPVLA